ncbi:MAG TPA: TetR/AcrR family transcriptional regulator [Longimicrobiales bacterium]|nr:TetR/AcrR family transcriptional regulator [Longimicrobiales bacterium]
MSPRPRKVSDEQVFAATQRVMGRVGPGDLTLGAIAAEAGVTAGALVQRFGSKRELLLEFTRRFAEYVPHMFAALRARSGSPLAALRTYVEQMAQMGESPAELAHHLSYLQLDFADPDFHEYARAQAWATRVELELLLAEARSAGEVPSDTDVKGLARALELTVNGSLITWAFYQDGTAADWMRRDFDALLERYGVKPAKVRRVRAAKPGAARQRKRRRS